MEVLRCPCDLVSRVKGGPQFQQLEGRKYCDKRMLVLVGHLHLKSIQDQLHNLQISVKDANADTLFKDY